MNGFDLSNITNCYIGSVNIDSIYLGSNLIWPSNFEQQYLTFDLLERGQFALVGYTQSFNNASIMYSTDNGATWTDVMLQSGVTPVFNAGTKVLWKGNLSTLVVGDVAGPDGFFRFDSTDYVSVSGRFKASGNPASLYFGDNFASVNTVYYYMYKFLFYDNIKLTSAKYLALPATTLTPGCYGAMFSGCTSLTEGPALPATTLAHSCYQSMFEKCSSLTTAPALPATTLADLCYNGMFSKCTSLTTAPALPATTLTYGCYTDMFSGCTSLTTAPALPATTLTQQCYQGMFNECRSLTAAPALPATTLADSCYYGMFMYCTSLTTAPALPATTLSQQCYSYMFNRCYSLSNIACLTTDISATDCTLNWVEYVASSGTFTKAASMNDWTTGTSGIPNNWSIVNAS